MTSGRAIPSTTCSRHFWKLERKKQVRDVMAPMRPPGRDVRELTGMQGGLVKGRAGHARLPDTQQQPRLLE